MSKLLAFQVARPAVVAVDTAVLEGYDAALQTLVWQGDETASMASAVCTRRSSGRHSCTSSGGTACRFGGSCSPNPNYYCYECDYG